MLTTLAIIRTAAATTGDRLVTKVAEFGGPQANPGLGEEEMAIRLADCSTSVAASQELPGVAGDHRLL